MASMLKPGDSAYAFVVAVAKRVREISQEAEDNHTIIEEKPVKLAVEEFANGKYKMVVHEHQPEHDDQEA